MIYISLLELRCHVETGDSDLISDEPYIIVAVADLGATLTVTGTVPLPTGGSTSADVTVPSPNSNVFLYGPFPFVDGGESVGVPFQAFWGLTGEERALPDPANAIFIVALMEHDNGNPESVRGIVAAQVTATLASTMGQDRPTRVGRLIKSVADALQTPTGFPNVDDAVGRPQSLEFTPAEIASAESGVPVLRSLQVKEDPDDPDGSAFYTLTFMAIKRGQNAWRFCHRCRALFFDGNPNNKGICPAGGVHAAAGFSFFIPHDQPGPFGGERARHCTTCFAMFRKFNALGSAPVHDVCPGGGRHTFIPDGFVFFLPHDHTGQGQEEWRLCKKCHVMFFNGEANKGACAAGGGHEADTQFNYKLDFTDFG